jgi:MFS family permease
MYDFLQSLNLTAAPLGENEVRTGLLDKWLGYIVHADRSDLASSNVADVFNSIINMVGTATTIIVIMLSANLARRFGKKAVAVAGFGLATLGTLAFYALTPTNVVGMLLLTILISIVYAPTIALVWAIYADVADYSEWKVGRRFTGMVFATIGFGLKSGLALGSAAFLWLMVGMFHYDPQGTPQFVAGDANHVASVTDVSALAGKLRAGTDPVSVHLREQLTPETRRVLESGADARQLEIALVEGLNRMIAGSSIYTADRFAGIELRKGTQELLAREERGEYESTSLNRLLLEDAYAKEISRQHNQPPDSRQGFRVQSAIVVGLMFAICTILLSLYPLNKQTTIQMADELAERRRRHAAG